MVLRLVALFGVALAVLLLLLPSAGTKGPAEPPSLVERTPPTAALQVDGPVRLNDVATRESVSVDDPAEPSVPRSDEDVPPLEPVAVVEEEHWIEGRVVLMDGAPVTDFRVITFEPPPYEVSRRELGRIARNAMWKEALATSELDELGRFRLGPLPERPYGIALMAAHTVAEDAVALVQAPTTTAELRFDGLLVVLEVPRDATMRKGSQLGADKLVVRSTNGTRSTRGGTTVMDKEGRTERLLPAGVGHHFRFQTRDDRLFEATLDEDTPPGRHHVVLQEFRYDPGAVRAVLRGDADGQEHSIIVVVAPISTPSERPGPRSLNVALRFEDGATTTEKGDVTPGRYTARAYILHPEDTAWVDAVARPEEIEVRPGVTAKIEVELLEGGRISVRVEGRPAAAGSEVRLEYYDAGLDRWASLRFQTTRGRRASGDRGETLSFAAPNVTERAFAPGPLRVRLRGDGWRTVETTVTIVGGRETTWSPRLERE
ncbi:MAG: hypothetical protein AAF957_01555 [Planctomycetota bacterium]